MVARDFGVTYLGVAAVPISGDIWTDGICYTALYEVTNEASIDDRYLTGIARGWFSDGSSTDGGNVEDGCTLAAVESAGYQSEFDLIGAGATANVYGAVIYVPEAAIGTLDLVTVDNSSPEDGGLDPEVVLDLTS